MSGKVDYKKDYKELYLPPAEPVIIEVPRLPFIVLDGTGDPNGEEFAKRVEALYSLSYAVKMSYKGEIVPPGYYEYTVFPLEGVWDLADKTKSAQDKTNYKYSIMIRQPDFLTAELFTRFLAQTIKKKPNPYLDQALFIEQEDGLSCQMLHIGSYDEEPQSFSRMEDYCQANGYNRLSLTHREIYLSDPRKTEEAKRKTVLRFTVQKGEERPKA